MTPITTNWNHTQTVPLLRRTSTATMSMATITAITMKNPREMMGKSTTMTESMETAMREVPMIAVMKVEMGIGILGKVSPLKVHMKIPGINAKWPVGSNGCHYFLGGVLTIADDLLKDGGRKFIEMMERLAERRIRREDEMSSDAERFDDDDEDEDEEEYESDDDEDYEDEYEDEDEDDEDVGVFFLAGTH